MFEVYESSVPEELFQRSPGKGSREHFETHQGKVAIKAKDPKDPESLHGGLAKGVLKADCVIRISSQYVTRFNPMLWEESVKAEAV